MGFSLCAFLSWVLESGRTPAAGGSISSWAWPTSKTQPNDEVGQGLPYRLSVPGRRVRGAQEAHPLPGVLLSLVPLSSGCSELPKLWTADGWAF